MKGDHQVRHCDRCQKNVYNLSELTSDQARLLLKEKEGRLCVRFWARSDGTVITRDCPIGVRWKTWRWAAALIALANVVGAALWSAWPALRPRPTADALGGSDEIQVRTSSKVTGKVMRNFSDNNAY